MAGADPNGTSGDEGEAYRRWNLRDLGGLPAKGGLVVAPRRLFRGGVPLLLTNDDRAAWVSLKLRTLVDLRYSTELVATGDVDVLNPAQWFRVPLFETPRRHWIAPSDQSPQATAGRYLEMLGDGLASVAAVVCKLSEPAVAPVLVCCTAGRDRTGIVVACLLVLLGVADDAIALDYARSDLIFQDGGRAHAATMVEFLKLVRARYGSVQRVLTEQGLPESTIEALRCRLLIEPA